MIYNEIELYIYIFFTCPVVGKIPDSHEIDLITKICLEIDRIMRQHPSVFIHLFGIISRI